MLKVFATQVNVSKGFENNPAVNFSKNGEMTSVRFRIGMRVYDSKAKDNTRWLNYAVKGFGPICNRIEKMKLKEGALINLVGRLDEDSWEDKNTHEKKSMPVIIVEDIEFASGGGKAKENEQASGTGTGNQSDVSSGSGGQAAATPNNAYFTGYEPYGANSFFDEN